MISVKLGARPPSLDLDLESSKASKELKTARQNFELLKKQDFNAYKNDDVRTALINCFHGKCGYCESSVAECGDIDVEHYRPKGKFRDHTDHPGYWWLAMRWDNLLLSCPHCNQPRRQIIVEDGMTLEEIEAAYQRGKGPKSLGKHDNFPMLNGIWVDLEDEDVSVETPIIISPTEDIDPESIFTWRTNPSDLALIYAHNDTPHAQMMIDILGLNRRWLFRCRMKHYGKLQRKLRQMTNCLERLSHVETEEAEDIIKCNLVEIIDDIIEKCAPDEAYAGMARAFLRRAYEILDSAEQSDATDFADG